MASVGQEVVCLTLPSLLTKEVQDKSRSLNVKCEQQKKSSEGEHGYMARAMFACADFKASLGNGSVIPGMPSASAAIRGVFCMPLDTPS